MLSRREPYERASWLDQPSELIRRFRDEMDRVFGDFGFGAGFKGLAGRDWNSVWSPDVEVFERDGQLVVHADLPGLKREDIKVNIEENVITIEGERKQQYEENREGVYRSERSYGRFYRSIPLPEGVDPDTANPNFNDGVLEITLAAPERQKRKARKIEIAQESTGARAKAASR
jgi:HSP20 family protein